MYGVGWVWVVGGSVELFGDGYLKIWKIVDVDVE